MKLLIDENLSPKLAARVADLFPGTIHVRDVGLKSADDLEVWEHARRVGAVILSKDEDLHTRALLVGHPPKVIRICLGNCSAGQVESLLRWRIKETNAFIQDEDAACLELR